MIIRVWRKFNSPVELQILLSGIVVLARVGERQQPAPTAAGRRVAGRCECRHVAILAPRGFRVKRGRALTAQHQRAEHQDEDPEAHLAGPSLHPLARHFPMLLVDLESRSGIGEKIPWSSAIPLLDCNISRGIFLYIGFLPIICR